MNLKNFLSKHKYWIVILSVVLLLPLLALPFSDQIQLLKSEEQLKSFINSFGVWGPIILMALIMAEVIIAPLPGGFLPLVSGAMFGPFLGTFYGWIASVLGSMVAFLLSRRYGDEIIHYIAPSFDHRKYDNTIKRGDKFIWLLFAFPLAASDILSIALGLSSMTFKKFLFIVSTAYLVRLVIQNAFGLTVFEAFIF